MDWLSHFSLFTLRKIFYAVLLIFGLDVNEINLKYFRYCNWHHALRLVLIPLDPGRILNVHSPFRIHPGRLLDILYRFSLRLVSMSIASIELSLTRKYLQSARLRRVCLVSTKSKCSCFECLLTLYSQACTKWSYTLRKLCSKCFKIPSMYDHVVDAKRFRIK